MTSPKLDMGLAAAGHPNLVKQEGTAGKILLIFLPGLLFCRNEGLYMEYYYYVNMRNSYTKCIKLY